MKLLDRKITNKISDMVSDIVDTCSRILSTEAKVDESASYDSKDDAKNRLKLVLMHDRSQLSPAQMEQMREEMLDVISRYVDIDRDTLDLCLEAETNTIALVANIPITRAKPEEETNVQNQIDQVQEAELLNQTQDEDMAQEAEKSSESTEEESSKEVAQVEEQMQAESSEKEVAQVEEGASSEQTQETETAQTEEIKN